MSALRSMSTKRGRGGPGEQLARDAVVAAFKYAQQVNAHALLAGDRCSSHDYTLGLCVALRLAMRAPASADRAAIVGSFCPSRQLNVEFAAHDVSNGTCCQTHKQSL